MPGNLRSLSGDPHAPAYRNASPYAYSSVDCTFRRIRVPRSHAPGGARGGLRYDRELFYLAAIRHDLGLTEAYDGPDSFELEGARAAYRLAREQGLVEDRARLLHEAIALHADVGRSHKREAEIVLVHWGAGMDVIGFRSEDLAPSTREAITAAAPRLAFKTRFPPLLEAQAKAKPECHMAGHWRLGFARKMQAAPFPE